MRLYEIEHAIDELFAESEDGELTHDQQIIFDSLQMAIGEKLESCAKFVLNCQADADKFDAEIKRLTKNRDAYRRKAHRARQFIEDYLKTNHIPELKGEHVKLKLCNSAGRVNVVDPSKLPLDYFEPQEPKISLAQIKSDIAAGKEVPGAEIVKNQYLKIS